MKRFALAGNPNCGKTTLFNSLTGSTAHVGNWPGVTVDKKEGLYKKLDEVVQIIDLPGIYSLSPYTSEEVISRRFLLEEKPDCIIDVVDATNLERNLYLTTQLMELNIPLVIALNMTDVLNEAGELIQVEELEKRLGIPVVSISALKNNNLEELMLKAKSASEKRRVGEVVYNLDKLDDLLKKIQGKLEENGVDNALFHSIKLLENDELEINVYPELNKLIEEFKKEFKDEIFSNDFEAIIADARYSHIVKEYAPLKIKKKDFKKKKLSPGERSEKIDKILTHRWWGIPCFILILFLVFHLVFSENFLFLGGLFSEMAPSFEGSIYEGLFWTNAGINSPGVILQNLVTMSTDFIQNSTRVWLEGMNVQSWAVGLLCDGMMAGVFSVLSFLPQILLLFLFFSILEDTGYMARVAFLLDCLLRRFGLSGRAIMPMIMGFGCSVPAMANTRTLADDREKIITIRVIPFFSCGAKLPILTAIAGAISTLLNVPYADLVTMGMYLLGMVVAILSILLMRQTSLKGPLSPFIMELPNYHVPQFRSLMKLLWDKMSHFVKKAFTIILASTIVIYFLSHLSWNWMFLSDEQIDQSILGSISMFLQPLFTPLGFGSQLTSWGWVFLTSAITGLIAKENVIQTFSVLAACIAGVAVNEGGDGVEEVLIMIQSTGITIPGLISFIAFNMLTIPCFAAVSAARAELPKGHFKWTLLFWLSVSYIVSSAVYLIGTWWWTSFIFLSIGLVGGYGLHLYNRKISLKRS